MKNYLVLLLFIAFLNNAYSQNNGSSGPRYGNDSIKCITNLSTMVEFARIRVYDYALPAWREVFNNCPKASKNIYIYGATIYKYLIDKEKDSIAKQNYIDTLLLVYDTRIKYFNEEGQVLIRKGMDLYTYRPYKREEIYNYLKKGIILSGVRSELNAMVVAFQISGELFKKNVITSDEFDDNYMKFIDILNKLKNANTIDPAIVQTIDIIDKAYLTINPQDCNKVEEINTPKLQAADTNADKLKQIIKILEMSRCTEGNAYFQALTKLYEFEPTSASANVLGKLNFKLQNYQKAQQYYLEAIEKDTNSLTKAQLYYELAAVEFSGLNQYAKAREHALQASELRKNWADPYILIANMYTASKNVCTENNKVPESVYWVAVDKLNYAKSIDPSKTEEINELIKKLAQAFPSKDDLFFQGINIGDSYTVKCWINETTKARAR
jgi:tetratricopeptide (TPR) repeat protein